MSKKMSYSTPTWLVCTRRYSQISASKDLLKYCLPKDAIAEAVVDDRRSTQATFTQDEHKKIRLLIASVTEILSAMADDSEL
jgi:hypothetical protein